MRNKKFRFFNGKSHSIDKNRLNFFENEFVKKFFGQSNVESSILMETLGPVQLDFADIMPWAQQIPDIHPKTGRLFTLWAEDVEEKKIVLILKGTFVLIPFELTITDFYDYTDGTSYYPLAVLNNFRTIYIENQDLEILITQTIEEINLFWRNLRKEQINQLDEGTELWKRYVSSFDKVLNISMVCSSLDKELLTNLKRMGFATTGVLQMMSRSDISYDDVIINEHMKKSLEVIRDSSNQ